MQPNGAPLDPWVGALVGSTPALGTLQGVQISEAGIKQNQAVAGRMGGPGMCHRLARHRRSTHGLSPGVQRSRPRHPSPSLLGAVADVYVSGLARWSGSGCVAPACAHAVRFTGATLDPYRVSCPGSVHGSQRVGALWGFSVLEPSSARGVLVSVLAHSSCILVRDGLAGEAPGMNRRCPTGRCSRRIAALSFGVAGSNYYREKVPISSVVARILPRTASSSF